MEEFVSEITSWGMFISNATKASANVSPFSKTFSIFLFPKWSKFEIAIFPSAIIPKYSNFIFSFNIKSFFCILFRKMILQKKFLLFHLLKNL